MDAELSDLLKGAPAHDVFAALDYLHARRRVRAIMNEESALVLPTNREKAFSLTRSVDR